MRLELTAVIKKVPESYIGFVEEIPGVNAQERTLEELRESLKEALGLVIETNRELARQDLDEATIREPLLLEAA
jgi:predicted RNase H-like HicB family nuclease